MNSIAGPLALVLLSVWSGSALADARAAAKVENPRPTPPASQVKPAPKVDPGMKIVRPTVPPASTPVIKPDATTKDGKVIVPK